MLNTKRTQIRSSQRKEELTRLFSFKRRQLLEGKSALFSHLYRRIEDQTSLNDGIYLVKDLISCLSNHPEEENTYILVGNYLFYHKQALQWFINPLTDRNQSRYLEYHMWTLYCGVEISLQFFSSTKDPSFLQHLQELTLTATSVSRLLLDNLKLNRCSTQKDIQIWILFLNMISLILDQKEADLPSETVQTFLEVLETVKHDLSPKKGGQKELSSTWNCLLAMFRGTQDEKLIRQLMTLGSNIFWLVLKHLPQDREDCLELLIEILSQVPGSFKTAVYTPQLLSQLLYLMQQIPGLRHFIVHILKLLIVENTLDNILLLLNQGTHKLLSRGLEEQIKKGDFTCLQESLFCLYQIMIRLHDENQLKLLYRVQNDIEELDFHRIVEELWNKPQNQGVTRVVGLITDDFYSEESAELI